MNNYSSETILYDGVMEATWHSLINFNKCTTPMQSIPSRKNRKGEEVYIGTLYFLLDFSINLKLP